MQPRELCLMVVLAGAEVRKPPAAELSAALFGTPEEAREMEVAAVHIQAAFRGYQSRHNHDSYRCLSPLAAACYALVRYALVSTADGCCAPGVRGDGSGCGTASTGGTRLSSSARARSGAALSGRTPRATGMGTATGCARCSAR